jgi:predicted transcriptional regulator
MQSIGLADDQSCAFPITQTELGQTTGMTSVHVNRSLNQLREAGLISFQKSRLQVLYWDGLAAAGDFDPGYLHLRDPLQARR